MKNWKWFFIIVFIVLLCGWAYYFEQNRIIAPYYPKSSFTLDPSIPTQSIIQKNNSVRIPILMYHYVEHVADVKDTLRQKLDISPQIFEKQLVTLHDASYSSLFIDDVADIIEGKKQAPISPIVLTFDDGYGDFYTDVFPLLKKYQMKATAYIISGVLGKPNYMTEEQVKEIAASGLVEIASHTVHHLNLKGATKKIASEEMRNSKTQLEALLGKPVPNFAYPYGAFSSMSAQLVYDAGYRTAASVIAGVEQSLGNRFYLYRLRPGSKTGQSLLIWLEKMK